MYKMILNPEDELSVETVAPPSSPILVPREITAAEILAERSEQYKSSYFPHGSGMGWSSMLWVSCDCPPCRNSYDPTGEHSANYLNMDYPSFFNGQSEKPSFAMSKIAKESYLAHMGPGFYIGNAKKPATLDDVVLVVSPPLPLKPKRILRIAENHDWDEFILSEDKTFWKRGGYVKGRSIWLKEDDSDLKIPFSELGKRLTELYGSV